MRTKEDRHQKYLGRRHLAAAEYQRRKASGWKQHHPNRIEGPLPRSGCCGVSMNRNLGKWKVQHRGEHLGYFINLEDAKATRKAAEAQYEENHAKS